MCNINNKGGFFMIVLLLSIIFIPMLFVFWCILRISSIESRNEEFIINSLSRHKKIVK